MLEDNVKVGLTFDDVLLLPAKSDILPGEVDVSAQLTQNIRINSPIVSAAMDTVTEAGLAIAIAREGGIGFIHRAMSVKSQVIEVDKVKKSESGMIVDPITMKPDEKIANALKIMAKYRISGVPITKNKKLVGILTNRDLKFETDLKQKASAVMTKKNLITAGEGITLEEAKKIVEFSKYSPVGKRGYGMRQSLPKFGPFKDKSDYLHKANEETTILIQVESSISAENIDEIISLNDGLVFYAGSAHVYNGL